jgi:hypothetical protein
MAIEIPTESKKVKSSKSWKVNQLSLEQQETQRKLDYIFDRVSKFCDIADRIENSLPVMHKKMPILRVDPMNSHCSSEDEFMSEEVLTLLKTSVAHLKISLHWQKFTVGFDEVLCGALILLERGIIR